MLNKDAIGADNPKLPAVILFGAGVRGRKLFSYVAKRYSVLYWVDNDKRLWGQKICDFKISSPDILINRTETVLLTVNHILYSEIQNQLEKYNINNKSIYSVQYSERKDDIALFPLEFKQIIYQNFSLEYYDSIKNKVDRNVSSEITIFCSFFTVYSIILIKNIKKRYAVSISLITRSHEYTDELKGLVDHIYCYDTYGDLADILHQLPKCELFQLLWVEEIWADFYEQIRDKCSLLYLFVGGSDLYRSSEINLKRKENLISVSDGIGIEMESVKDDFLKAYPSAKDKTAIVRYGLEYIDNCCLLPMRQEILTANDIPSNKVIVVCGHNAVKANRHKELIASLKRIDKGILDRCFFIFPMTYGDALGEYTKEITRILGESNLQYRVLNDFMTFQKLAEFISITDIHIKVQTTDALSSTLLEYMYAGAVVITGKWLPYQPLRNKGIVYKTVNTIEDVTKVLSDIVNKLDYYKEECKVNRKIIYDMSSWDRMAKRWMSFWNMDTELIEHDKQN